ncbi:MAG: type 4a pilus biogenesis protein PilO [Smithellaceae bacterium]|jgi:type IV pilus assembly protein PilO|nr:type 4a pilus biogenesis protein PilO [Smithellaceae bacterium]
MAMDFNIDEFKKLSPQVKALILVVVIFLTGYLYYFYFLSDTLAKTSQMSQELEELQTQIQQKENIVRQMDRVKTQVASLKENYQIALLKLPSQREIPGLFYSVATAGRETGVEFVLFEPQASVPQTLEKAEKLSAKLKPSDTRQEEQEKKAGAGKPGEAKKAPSAEPFYEEIPVKVTVTGSFQNIVAFFDKLAKLTRIVNISDISMGDRKEGKRKKYVITASCIVKTYMFVDKKEQANEKKN